MIFVTVGSREYQFNRLIKQIDKIIEEHNLKDEFFLQIGSSEYLPKKAEYKRFLNKDEFVQYQDKADIIISHGGTGSLVSALKKEKQVIAVPRLKKYDEHIDDHQLQVTSALAKSGFLLEIKNLEELFDAIVSLKNEPIQKQYVQKSRIPKLLDEFIQKESN